MLGRQFIRQMSNISCQEVSIPVPWGKIAAKHWVSSSAESGKVTPWIVVHGWLDNAGSFDTLAPLFLSSHPQHSLLCIDYPGHGYSSHIPQGQMYHYLESLRYIRYVAEHQGLERFSLMGHSMGAGLSSVFAAVYPEMVQSLIMIDLVKPVGRRLENYIEKTRLSLDSFLAIEKKLAKTSEKVYSSEEEAFTRLQEAARVQQGEGSVTDESARIILKRGVVPCEGGFKYSRDLRHKAISLYGLTDDLCFEFAKNIKCPHLLIKANGSPNYEDDNVIDAMLDLYKKNPNFEMVYVDGSHHVHLNNPERVIPCIQDFVNKH